MSNDRTLPLFNWIPPVKIIPFPASKQIGKARHVARLFMNKTTERAQASYWEQTETSIRKRLEKIGLADDEIERQVQSFTATVQREVDLLCHREGMRK
ncbi:DUF6074 family protein [Ahrensia kielensis]|uniref:DUF6074 family protein n=1 Tax=Ahrensia kielensis TaxID=76980 RepID=UPI000372CEA5|nr:DUF6074 family protein [Ahrensia kielensis]